VADTFTAANDVAELVARTCIAPATAVTGVERLFAVHWPAMLGTAPYPLAAFSLESTGAQGLAYSSWLPAALVLLSAAGIALARHGAAEGPPRFAQYLVLTGLLSAVGYVAGRCGEVSFYVMRYEMLSLLGLCGLLAWFLSVRPPAPLLAAWTVVFTAWMAIVAWPHVRLAREYATHPPVPAKHQLIRALERDGVRYGTADYWLAYYIDFLTNERIVFAATSPQRILLYNRIVAAHPGEAIRLSRSRCDGGTLLVAGVYRCP
jgi:hypothetical protein